MFCMINQFQIKVAPATFITTYPLLTSITVLSGFVNRYSSATQCPRSELLIPGLLFLTSKPLATTVIGFVLNTLFCEYNIDKFFKYLTKKKCCACTTFTEIQKSRLVGLEAMVVLLRRK